MHDRGIVRLMDRLDRRVPRFDFLNGCTRPRFPVGWATQQTAIHAVLRLVYSVLGGRRPFKICQGNIFVYRGISLIFVSGARLETNLVFFINIVGTLYLWSYDQWVLHETISLCLSTFHSSCLCERHLSFLYRRNGRTGR